MYVYEIIKKQPEKPKVSTAPIHLLPHVKQVGRSIILDKTTYTLFVEGEECKGKFKVGDLVCLRTSPIIPGIIPSMIGQVRDIQEIYYMAQWDEQTRQPRCLGIQSDQHQGTAWYAPARVRKLTDEEVINVRLRDKEEVSVESTILEGEHVYKIHNPFDDIQSGAA